MSQQPQILISPDKVEKAVAAGDEARRLRDQSMIAMHKSDPIYWSGANLARYWRMTRQNVKRIFDRHGIRIEE